MNSKKLIDKKRRVFKIINVIDLTILLFIILLLFIVIKFVYFTPNFFHYKNLSVEVLYPNISIKSIPNFSEGETHLYNDDISALVIPSDKYIICSDKEADSIIHYYVNKTVILFINKTSIVCNDRPDHRRNVYFLKSSVSQFTDKLKINCLDDRNDLRIYFFDRPYIPLNDNQSISCLFNNYGLNLTYSDLQSDNPVKSDTINCQFIEQESEPFSDKELMINASAGVCNIYSHFNLRSRIIDGRPFYKEYSYPVEKGGRILFSFDNLTLPYGDIIDVHEGFNNWVSR